MEESNKGGGQLDDSVLDSCNETELLSMANTQGLGRLRRGLPKQVLIDIVRGAINPAPEYFSQTSDTRQLLESFIEKHWEQVRSQLPGCNGKCTTYPCSEGRHALCYTPNQDMVKNI